MNRWMTGPVLAMGLGLAAVAAEAPEKTTILPSGGEARLHETLWQEARSVYRLRFVAPGFDSNEETLDLVAKDLEYLCQQVALPRLTEQDGLPHRIIISLASEARPFGQYDPDVAQVFEAFRVQNGTCIWEIF